jgi:aminoglycoside N3'-acetyltransferase
MNDFSSLMDAIGLAEGDSLFVHCGFSRLKRFRLPPEGVIEALARRIGNSGTLIMPSFSLSFSVLKGYCSLQAIPEFDVVKTPSNLGLLSETFRTLKGVRRGANPVFSVCAGGPLAETLTARQEYCEGWGPGSSLKLTVEHGAKLVGLGVSLNTTALCSVVDFMLGESHAQVVFRKERTPVEVVLHSGQKISTGGRLMRVTAARANNPSAMFELLPRLKEQLRFINLEGDYFFSYPAAEYHRQTLETGRQCFRQGLPMPWFKAVV